VQQWCVSSLGLLSLLKNEVVETLCLIKMGFLKTITVEVCEVGLASCLGVSFLGRIFRQLVGMAVKPVILEALS